MPQTHGSVFMSSPGSLPLSAKEKPENVFYQPKLREVTEDISCPYCKEWLPSFTYGNDCPFCYERIASPWKPHTGCPQCGTLINLKEIREGYILVDGTGKMIECPKCQKPFDWKKHRQNPELRMLKYCEVCDMPYSPDEKNWSTQRSCPECKRSRRDQELFRREHPTYQKEYRKRKK
jgi:endogenous inhibitor of DNA gyrase (YacG/DUF329 family)